MYGHGNVEGSSSCSAWKTLLSQVALWSPLVLWEREKQEGGSQVGWNVNTGTKFHLELACLCLLSVGRGSQNAIIKNKLRAKASSKDRTVLPHTAFKVFQCLLTFSLSANFTFKKKIGLFSENYVTKASVEVWFLLCARYSIVGPQHSFFIIPQLWLPPVLWLMRYLQADFHQIL